MALQNINTSFPNDGLGDALRDAFNKQNEMNTELYEIKVDKVAGQGLSDNNLTDELIQKIESNEENSQENIQSDWNQTDDTLKDFIKNKPDTTDVDIRMPLMVPFDFVVNSKGVINGLHGSFLINDSEDGIVLNPTTQIVGDGGQSRVLAAVLSGTVITGSFTITGTSVDPITGVLTENDSEIVLVDGLSINGSYDDSNGNRVWDYTNTYISAKLWQSELTFSTTDLDLTEVRFAQVEFEQFNGDSSIIINSLSATYIINNAAAYLDAYLYAVDVGPDNITRVSAIGSIHQEPGFLADSSLKQRVSELNKAIDGATSGIFIDLFLGPDTQAYFNSFSLKVWGTSEVTASFYRDNSLVVDSITYGEDLIAGNVAYLASDGTYYTADNTDVAKSSTQLRLIAQSGLTGDEKNAIVTGNYTTTGGLTAGNEFLNSSGGFTDTQPTTGIVRVLSTAIDSLRRYFNPGSTWVQADGTKVNGVTMAGGGGGGGDAYLANNQTFTGENDFTKRVVAPDFISGSGWSGTRIDLTDANPVIDWFAGDTAVMAQLTKNIVMVFNNLPQGQKTKTLSMDATGQYSISLPSYCQKFFGVYDGTKLNTYTFECVNGNSGSEFIRYWITTKENEATI